MKLKFTQILALCSAALLMVFASCKKDGELVKASGTPTAGALTASATTVSLSKATLTSNAVTFTSSNPNFGYDAAVTTTLQMAVKGTNFAKPKEVSLTGKNVSQSYTVQDFNNILLGLNMTTGVSGQIEVRMKYTISTAATAPMTYSNVVTLTATPFALTSYVYVPGAYQGWDPAKADSLQSASGNGVYTGIINFSGSSDLQFKVTSDKKGSTWYGNLDGGVSSSGSAVNFMFLTKATVDPNVNIMSDLVTLDQNKNSITITPTLWSVVGDATSGGWPNGSGVQSDTDMKYNNGTQTWSVITTLKTGAIKFRKNHDWSVSYGSVTTPGKLDTADNNNINITTAGTYLITIDLNALTYTLTKQ